MGSAALSSSSSDGPEKTRLSVYGNSWIRDCHLLDPKMSPSEIVDLFTRLKDCLYGLRLCVPDITDRANLIRVAEAIAVGVDTLKFDEQFLPDDDKYHLNTRIKDVIQDGEAFVRKYGPTPTNGWTPSPAGPTRATGSGSAPHGINPVMSTGKRLSTREKQKEKEKEKGMAVAETAKAYEAQPNPSKQSFWSDPPLYPVKGSAILEEDEDDTYGYPVPREPREPPVVPYSPFYIIDRRQGQPNPPPDQGYDPDRSNDRDRDSQARPRDRDEQCHRKHRYSDSSYAPDRPIPKQGSNSRRFSSYHTHDDLQRSNSTPIPRSIYTPYDGSSSNQPHPNTTHQPPLRSALSKPQFQYSLPIPLSAAPPLNPSFASSASAYRLSRNLSTSFSPSTKSWHEPSEAGVDSGDRKAKHHRSDRRSDRERGAERDGGGRDREMVEKPRTCTSSGTAGVPDPAARALPLQSSRRHGNSDRSNTNNANTSSDYPSPCNPNQCPGWEDSNNNINPDTNSSNVKKNSKHISSKYHKNYKNNKSISFAFVTKDGKSSKRSGSVVSGAGETLTSPTDGKRSSSKRAGGPSSSRYYRDDRRSWDTHSSCSGSDQSWEDEDGNGKGRDKENKKKHKLRKSRGGGSDSGGGGIADALNKRFLATGLGHGLERSRSLRFKDVEKYVSDLTAKFSRDLKKKTRG